MLSELWLLSLNTSTWSRLDTGGYNLTDNPSVLPSAEFSSGGDLVSVDLKLPPRTMHAATVITSATTHQPIMVISGGEQPPLYRGECPQPRP